MHLRISFVQGIAIALAGLGFAVTVSAATLTVDVDGVRSDVGKVFVSLCGDQRAPFPGVWPSARFADRIVARLQGARFRHAVEHLSYEGAGHFVFVGAPDGMLSRAATAASGGMMRGSREANAAAWQDNWPRTLSFLANALRGAAR